MHMQALKFVPGLWQLTFYLLKKYFRRFTYKQPCRLYILALSSLMSAKQISIKVFLLSTAINICQIFSVERL